MTCGSQQPGCKTKRPGCIPIDLVFTPCDQVLRPGRIPSDLVAILATWFFPLATWMQVLVKFLF